MKKEDKICQDWQMIGTFVFLLVLFVGTIYSGGSLIAALAGFNVSVAVMMFAHPHAGAPYIMLLGQICWTVAAFFLKDKLLIMQAPIMIIFCLRTIAVWSGKGFKSFEGYFFVKKWTSKFTKYLSIKLLADKYLTISITIVFTMLSILSACLGGSIWGSCAVIVICVGVVMLAERHKWTQHTMFIVQVCWLVHSINLDNNALFAQSIVLGLTNLKGIFNWRRKGITE